VNIGRLLGIPIRIHYTLWLVFLLIAWSLAVGYMPRQYPNQSQITYWEIGVASALILFLSVLIHELSHSYIAKRNNLPIARITLFFFGGVSEMTEEPKDPGVEVRMAAAGPLTSFLIGVVLGSVWYLGLAAKFPVAATATLQYGAEINLILGAFNLLPAFPLDGGRVFRGGLWGRSKNLLSATKTATRLSESIAFLMMTGGFVILIFANDLFDGIWFFFLGWFIRSGAETSLRRTLLSESLAGILVGDIMTKDVRTVSPDITIQQLVSDFFLTHSHSAYPVVVDGNVVGMVTMDGVRSIPKERRETEVVREAMLPREKILISNPQMPAGDLLQKMAEVGLDSAIVLDGGRLVGIVTSRDIMRTMRAKQALTA
jgi:Zn-dependent protease/CBS domain-containing protein